MQCVKIEILVILFVLGSKRPSNINFLNFMRTEMKNLDAKEGILFWFESILFVIDDNDYGLIMFWVFYIFFFSKKIVLYK